MSKVGRKVINIPDGVFFDLNFDFFSIRGKFGTVKQYFSPTIFIFIFCNNVAVFSKFYNSIGNPIIGTICVIIENAIYGVCFGYKKSLTLNGVGYRAYLDGLFLKLRIGYSHEVCFRIPKSVFVEVVKLVNITINGVDKEIVGCVASGIFRQRPFDSYKGKGICYDDKKMILKEIKKKQ